MWKKQQLRQLKVMSGSNIIPLWIVVITLAKSNTQRLHCCLESTIGSFRYVKYLFNINNVFCINCVLLYFLICYILRDY